MKTNTKKLKDFSRLVKLHTKAEFLYGKIEPCCKKTWRECLTDLGLWFNKKSGTTSIIQD